MQVLAPLTFFALSYFVLSFAMHIVHLYKCLRILLRAWYTGCGFIYQYY
jgi:hypothetical protein